MTPLVYRGNPPGKRLRNGSEWRRVQAIVLESTDTCWLCGRPVNRDVPARHPQAPSVDHVVPVSIAPEHAYDLSNLRLAHLGCNSRRGARPVQVTRKTTTTHTRTW